MKEECYGTWASAEIMEMVQENTINCKEAFLLSIVDALIKIEGKDCFATNRYLGKKLGTGERQIKKMISRLKEIGLLKQTDYNGHKRFLTTCYSHIEKQEGGKKISPQGGRKVPPRGEEKFPPGGKKSSPIYNIDYITKNNSFSQQHEVADTVTGWKSKKEWMVYATLLKNAVATVRKVNKTSDTWRWAEAISKIESVDKIPIQRIESVLKWYCKQITQGDLIRDNSSYIPIAYSGAAFREKFDRIEAAKKRIAKNDISTGEPQYRYKKTIVQNDYDEGDEI